MAISTPASIATPITPGTTNATMALTTNASVASGGKVWVFVSWFHSTVTLNGVSDGGSTVFTIDHQSKNGSTGVAIVSADYPTGFASGGTLTATFSASGAADQQMAAFYSTGVQSGSGAGYGAIGGSNNASTTWDAGATTVLNGDILIGLSKFEDSVTTTSAPTGGNTELADWNNAGGFASTVTYQIGTGASIHAQGTWSNTSAASLGTRSCSVAYTAAPTAAGGYAPARISNRMVGPMVQRYYFRQPQVWGSSTGPAVLNQAMTADVVAVTASMLKQVNKLVTATTIAVTASFLNQVNKLMTATTVAVTASIAAVKVKLQTMTATTVVVTASMLKQVNKIMTATSVAVTASIVKQVNKILTSTAVAVTASLTTIKVKLVTMTATAVVVTASMVRQVNKLLTADSVALSASIIKQVNKRLTATTVAVTASLTTIKVKLQAMTATTVVVTASMLRQTQLHLSSTVATSASIVKRIAKTLSASSIVAATLDAIKSGVATFFTAAFDATVGRGRSGDDPHQGDYQSDAHGRIGSDPHQGGFD